MDPMTTSALISTGGSLLGGLLGGGGTSWNKQRKQMQEQLSDQKAYQYEIDTERPSWVVKGAQAAGISPLVALGMQPISTPGVSIGSDTKPQIDFQSMGQNLGRAAEAYMSQDQRAKQAVVDQLALERAQLENDLLRSQISSVNNSSRTPGMPGTQSIPGQTASHPYHDGNVIPEQSTVRTRFGEMRIPSADYAQVMENYWPETWRYMFREGNYDIIDSGRRMYSAGQRLGRKIRSYF